MWSSQKSKCHVVIINWNGADDTKECLESLLHHESNIVVTVIDNSELHVPCQSLEGQFPSVRFVYNDVNIGFAKACNQGCLLKGNTEVSYTLFLNNDTVITMPFIDEITSWMDTKQNIAAVSPVINYHFDPDKPWFSGSVIDGKTMDIVHCNLNVPKVPTVVPWLTGCALVVRNELFIYVGGFDEMFFLYSEDVDLSLKLVNSGYDLVIYPLMSVLHKVAQSSKKVSNVSTYYATRNKVLILRRYFPTRVILGVARILRLNIVLFVNSDIAMFIKVMLIITTLKACVRGLTMKKAIH